MAIKEWTKVYGTGGLDSTSNMPDLADETAPGAGDGDEQRSSQVEAPRDSLIELETQMGDPTAPAAGSVLATKPTTDEKAALAGTDGVPSGTNKYVTNSDSRLSDSRTPTTHASSHENGGGDEISVAGLSGELADDQNADAIRTTDGPTLLAVGAIADGEVLQRSGSTIVGGSGGGAGSDTTAIHDDTAGEISAITYKGSPVSGDILLIEDSAAGNAKKYTTVGDLPTGSTSPLTTKGDLYTHDSADARLPVGTDGQFLVADSGETTGLKWTDSPHVAVGDFIVLTDGQPISTIAINASDIQVIPETGAGLAFKALNSGRYAVRCGFQCTTSSSASTAGFYLVFDEGEANEQTVTPGDTWRVRAASGTYNIPSFETEIELTAGAHTVKLYGSAVTGTTFTILGSSVTTNMAPYIVLDAMTDGLLGTADTFQDTLSGNIAMSSDTPTLLSPESGSHSYVCKNAGTYRVDAQFMAYFQFSSAATNWKFYVVFDEGESTEVKLGDNEFWGLRVASNQTNDYVQCHYNGFVDLVAKTYTVKLYGYRETGGSGTVSVISVSTGQPQITVNSLGASQYPMNDTKPPRGVYASATTVDFSRRLDQDTTVRRTLQDGKQRSFTGTLNWAVANGVADLGYDEVASQGNSKWLYWYLVPSSSDDNLLTVRASDNDPSVGPTGYTDYKYCWSTYIDGSGNLRDVKQVGNEFMLAAQTVPYSPSSVAPFSITSLSLAAHVPSTAGLVEIQIKMDKNSSGDWQWWVSPTSGSKMYKHLQVYLGGASGVYTAMQSFKVPLYNAQTIYHELNQISGSGNLNYAELTVQGWVDQHLEA